MNALMLGVDKSGNQVPLLLGSDGSLTNEPATTPWAYAAASGGITGTTPVTLAAAAGAGLANYMTGLQIHNKHATVATEVTISDTISGNVLARFYAPAAMTGPMGITFPTAIASGPNSALTATCVTTGSATYVNAQGYTDGTPTQITSASNLNLNTLFDDNGDAILDDLGAQILIQ